MRQTIRNQVTPPVSRVPQLTRYATLIRLKRLHTPRQLGLALQALTKILRCQEQSVQLLVATDDGDAWPRHPPSRHCSFHTSGELHHALRHCDIRILAPTFNDPQDTLTLHALASGVSLTALNLAPLSTQARAALALDGNALLAMGKAQPPPH